MHWCTPKPKPRCPRGFRSISRVSGWSTNAASQLPAGRFISTRSPALMSWPLMVRSSRATRSTWRVHDGQVAHQLLDDVGDKGRVIGLAQPFECVGMLQQCHGAQRDHARRRFVAGLQQDHAVHHRGLTAEFTLGDVVGDQPAHQVVTGFALLERGQFPHVVEHGPDRRHLLFVGRSGVESLRAVVLKELVLLVGDAEQQADHQRRHRQREVADQVGGRPGLDHVVQESVDEILDLWPHRLGSPEGEVPGHHSTQSVVLGIVDAGEDHRDVVVGRPRLQGLGKGVRGQPRIGQRRPDVFVSADEPRRLMPPQDHLQAVGMRANRRTRAGASADNGHPAGSERRGCGAIALSRGRRHWHSSNRQPAATSTRA